MKKILLCTDGSPYAEVCCRYAAWLAKRTHANIEAIYASDLRQFELSVVADLSGCMGIQPYQGMISQIQQMEAQKSDMIEAGTRSYFESQGLGSQFKFHTATGLLVDRIEELEKQHPDIDLVMLGKRGENANFATEHLGSSMERVVRASRKPSLVTSRKFHEIKKILFAYDGSDSCKKALQLLCRTDAFKDLELHVVTIDDGGRSDHQADQILKEAQLLLEQSNWKPTCEVLTGLAENVIADYVVSQGMDILIMGAYGHSRIRHLIIGSTTTDLIRRCHISVLLFR
ncbi:MAG TPA: universal stress protein [Opitutales bacterium]|nr:universal stress protein [Opitutales bacterium]